MSAPKISVTCHRVLLPGNTYIYINERWSTNSWVDHVVARNDFHNSISKIDIIDDASDKYDIPIKMYVNIECIHYRTAITSNGSTHVRWNCMTDNNISKYCILAASPCMRFIGCRL